ncbi:polysaccharide biosynthesis/export family protein [Mariluticola halotolerans]|uniref:polysaccharide biosynthesis/export family protein n=1 Tax=Mariluticola halotolerans TaxID=2909283 RepID=UPI0026E17B80|nr:polysaccharide biosynthesis/export family protein [Mariluticola halotolerans]UJQ95634.1 polysaccharide export protein [Mariluticola halotolerans]
MQVLRFIVILALLIPVAACAVNTRGATYLVETKGPYTLDTGDAVRVTVYGDETLSDTYRLDDTGSIALPLVGPVPARGVTTQQAASRIAVALADGFMRSPNVAVEIAEYRPFFIQGEVANSGQFPYVYGMTVRAAISTAGGYSETADRSRALVYRRQGGEMVKGSVALDFPIYPGDTIVVLDRWL